MSGGNDIYRPVGSQPTPPSSPGGKISPAQSSKTGETPLHSVTGAVNVKPQLGNLPDSKTPTTSLAERDIEEAEGKSIVGNKEESLEGLSDKKLLEKQEEKFKEVKKLSKKYEEHSVMDRAMAALGNPNNAPKDLVVKITFPGKQPITLIPYDPKALEGEDVTQLLGQATQILSDHKEKEFKGYDPERATQEMNYMKDIIKQIADKTKDNQYKEGSDDHDNKWEVRWKEVRHQPVMLTAFGDGTNDSDRPLVGVERAEIKKDHVNPEDEISELRNTAEDE